MRQEQRGEKASRNVFGVREAGWEGSETRSERGWLGGRLYEGCHFLGSRKSGSAYRGSGRETLTYYIVSADPICCYKQ